MDRKKVLKKYFTLFANLGYVEGLGLCEQRFSLREEVHSLNGQIPLTSSTLVAWSTVCNPEIPLARTHSVE